MQATEFAQFAVGDDPVEGVGEFNHRKRLPKVFSEFGRDRLLAEKGNLF